MFGHDTSTFFKKNFDYSDERIYQHITDEMSSATSGLVDRTVNWIVTSSARANRARNNTSKPPRNVPILEGNDKRNNV